MTAVYEVKHGIYPKSRHIMSNAKRSRLLKRGPGGFSSSQEGLCTYIHRCINIYEA